MTDTIENTAMTTADVVTEPAKPSLKDAIRSLIRAERSEMDAFGAWSDAKRAREESKKEAERIWAMHDHPVGAFELYMYPDNVIVTLNEDEGSLKLDVNTPLAIS